MTAPSDHDLLIQLNAKVDAFYGEFRRTSNGDGFPRCAERLARLKALEEDNKNLRGRLWWALTTAITSSIGLVISFLKGD